MTSRSVLINLVWIIETDRFRFKPWLNYPLDDALLLMPSVVRPVISSG